MSRQMVERSVPRFCNQIEVSIAGQKRLALVQTGQ